jgi:hypothetical protein
VVDSVVGYIISYRVTDDYALHLTGGKKSWRKFCLFIIRYILT